MTTTPSTAPTASRFSTSTRLSMTLSLVLFVLFVLASPLAARPATHRDARSKPSAVLNHLRSSILNHPRGTPLNHHRGAPLNHLRGAALRPRSPFSFHPSLHPGATNNLKPSKPMSQRLKESQGLQNPKWRRSTGAADFDSKRRHFDQKHQTSAGADLDFRQAENLWDRIRNAGDYDTSDIRAYLTAVATQLLAKHAKVSQKSKDHKNAWSPTQDRHPLTPPHTANRAPALEDLPSRGKRNLLTDLIQPHMNELMSFGMDSQKRPPNFVYEDLKTVIEALIADLEREKTMVRGEARLVATEAVLMLKGLLAGGEELMWRLLGDGGR